MAAARGKVYLVGAGPGDPALITLRAVECLRQAEVIIYDYLVNQELLQHGAANATYIYVGKQAGAHTLSQEEINALLVAHGREKTVVRLKGGDPFIFGRGGEEALALAEASIPFEVVPGVTSAIAVPAYAGIPLTHRQVTSSVALVTGHEMAGKEDSAINWQHLAKGVGTLVFLMGVRNLEEIAAQLIASGRSPETPAAVIRWGTTRRQRTVVASLADLAAAAIQAEIAPPAIIVIGEVVSLREQLNWFESRPLFGRTVVVTRAREQASEFRRLLEAHGAQCLEFPTIAIEPPPTWEPVDRAIQRLHAYQWLIFTSVNGVRHFFDRLHHAGKDARALAGLRLAAIGPQTAAALTSRGLLPDLVPTEYRAEAILQELEPHQARGQRFLLPRALEAREVLPETLRQMGAEVEVVPVYQTVIPEADTGEIRGLLRAGQVHCITFTSSSTVRNFVALLQGEDLDALLANVKVACIGPITAETARQHGIRVDLMPATYTIEALAAEVVKGLVDVKP